MKNDPIQLALSEHSGTHVYFQLAKAIQEQIEKGELAAGALVPSERKIASKYKISIATVRRAYEELVNKGLLKRIQGKGTFVTSTADRRLKIRYYPFVDSIGDELAVLDIKLLGLRIIPGIAEINQQLQIKGDQKLYEVRRRLCFESKPLVYAKSFLPKKMFPRLENCDPEIYRNYAFYIFLENKFNVPTISHTELISVALADEDSATVLQVQEKTPVLEIEKTIFTHKNKPYEYRISYCRTDAAKLKRVY
jgi:GntR family transcriptional regulator